MNMSFEILWKHAQPACPLNSILFGYEPRRKYTLNQQLPRSVPESGKPGMTDHGRAIPAAMNIAGGSMETQFAVRVIQNSKIFLTDKQKA
jgi:hypothetical protein